jgi:hypothetical protein
MNILVNSTSLALWHEIIHEAEKTCAVKLQDTVEAYLVFLIMRYVSKPEMAKQVIAPEFLAGMQEVSPIQRELILQGVGDKCLLFSGLFPKMTEKRLVKISYFVNLGQSAYGTLAKTSNDIYSLLTKQFVTLMDVLQSIRHYDHHFPDLLPIQAYDLWNETGSQRAFTVLRQYTSAVPVSTKARN